MLNSQRFELHVSILQKRVCYTTFKGQHYFSYQLVTEVDHIDTQFITVQVSLLGILTMDRIFPS